MAKLRHISIAVPDVESAAVFYEKTFDLECVRKTEKTIWLSDGTVNLTLTPTESFKGTDKEGYVGIDHLGFVVDSKEEAGRKLEENGGRSADGKCYDPHGIMVNLNDKYWVGSK
jgi:catechol 2,3-dioxygenase-like lactoylglutathione lyase family enzyme